MLVRFLRVFGLPTLFFLSSGSSFAQDDCELRKDQEGIKIYACKSPQSKYRTIKAEFEVNASLNDFAAVMLDIDKYIHWQYKTVKSHVVKKIDENELVYYTEIGAPWPMSNRDVTVHLKLVRDVPAKKMTITSKSVEGYLPEKENMVRVPMSNATWVVTALSEMKSKVNYRLEVEPGGSVSPWMLNMVSDEGPFESFRDLRKMFHAKK